MGLYKESLLNKIEDDLTGRNQNWEALDKHEKNTADEFDATKTYAVGDYAIRDNVLYRCVVAVEEAGEWNSTNWVVTDLATEITTHLAEDAQKHIAESGSNDNGRYIKFDDGTMICLGDRDFTNVPCTNAIGSMYYAGGPSFPMGTYPHAFNVLSEPVKLFLESRNADSLTAWHTMASFTATNGNQIQVSINYLRHTSTTFDKVTISFLAEGRWK